MLTSENVTDLIHMIGELRHAIGMDTYKVIRNNRHYPYRNYTYYGHPLQILENAVALGYAETDRPGSYKVTEKGFDLIKEFTGVEFIDRPSDALAPYYAEINLDFTMDIPVHTDDEEDAVIEACGWLDDKLELGECYMEPDAVKLVSISENPVYGIYNKESSGSIKES